MRVPSSSSDPDSADPYHAAVKRGQPRHKADERLASMKSGPQREDILREGDPNPGRAGARGPAAKPNQTQNKQVHEDQRTAKGREEREARGGEGSGEGARSALSQFRRPSGQSTPRRGVSRSEGQTNPPKGAPAPAVPSPTAPKPAAAGQHSQPPAQNAAHHRTPLRPVDMNRPDNHGAPAQRPSVAHGKAVPREQAYLLTPRLGEILRQAEERKIAAAKHAAVAPEDGAVADKISIVSAATALAAGSPTVASQAPHVAVAVATVASTTSLPTPPRTLDHISQVETRGGTASPPRNHYRLPVGRPRRTPSPPPHLQLPASLPIRPQFDAFSHPPNNGRRNSRSDGRDREERGRGHRS